MATVFWDAEGVIPVDFLPRGETINSEAYIQTLTRLRARIRRVRPNLPIDKVLLLHDNARPHTSIRTRETITLYGWTTLPHPPYSPDLAPSDYHLFGPPWKRVWEANIIPVTKKWKLQWRSGSKNSQQNFTRQGYMLSLEGGTLLLSETVTMLRSKDVIQIGPASFWCMIHVPVLITIPVLKKMALIFDSPSYYHSRGALYGILQSP